MAKFSKSIRKAALLLIDELDLTIAQVGTIRGSGKGGVLVKADVLAYSTGKFIGKMSKANSNGKLMIQYEDLPLLRFRIRDALCGLRQTMGPAGRLEIYTIDGNYFTAKPVEPEEVPFEQADPVVQGENFEVS